MAIFMGVTKVSDIGGSGGGSTPVDLTDLIDDQNTSLKKVYSSEKTEARLTEVQNLIGGGQNDNVKMWQKTYLNVVNGQVLPVNSTDFSLEKTIVQPYKFVEGNQDVVEILKTFDNTEAENFIFDDEMIDFSGVMKIRDSYPLTKTLNNENLYETEIIDKNQFVDFYRIEEA